MKFLLAPLSAIMMAAAIVLPSRAESNSPMLPAVQDTLILKVKNNARVIVVVKDLKDIKSLKEIKLDSLITVLEKHVDEIERAGKDAATNPVTVTITQDDQQSSNDVNITITQQSGDKKTIISKEIKNVRVGVDINEDGDKTTIGVNVKKDTTMTGKEKKTEEPKDRYSRKNHEIQLDYGADRWLNTSSSGDGLSQKASFRPIASRYFSFNSKWHRRLGGQESPARISYGFAFEFHNFMFDDNQLLINTGARSVIMESAQEIEKSKLSTTSFTIPLELSFDVKNKNGKTAFRIGGGGFAGYLLDSKTKVVFTENGDTKTRKVKEDFHLQDLQYGVSGFIGIRDMDIFAKYNLNDMFKGDKGPAGNALAVGLRWNL